ncbi:MAG: Na(+)-translocating NADH-quinone reductase subunit A [Candidatus Hydrogenedentota bacterium]
MAVHRVTKGLNLPIAGEPLQQIEPARTPGHVALLGADYHGMRPTLFVREGDSVKRGQALFEDKKTPGVLYTSPAAGTVKTVHRGAKRAFQSLVIELSDAERDGSAGTESEVTFQAYLGKDPSGLSRDQITALLTESGLWTAFRMRPFSKVPQPGTMPHSIFVTAMDSNPLAPSVEVILKGQEDAFANGLVCVAKLTEGRTYLCKAAGSAIPANPNTGITIEEFSGPHPSGTPGYHIHTLDPVYREKTVWYIGLQDVIAIGRLFATGRLFVDRVIALAGPQVKKPRLLRTRIGASLADICAGELNDGENRVISGSVLSGRKAMGEAHGYLGRFHQQVSVIAEGRDRDFLGWLAPGTDKFSVLGVFASKWIGGGKKFNFTTTTNGSERSIVPVGSFERVMPMDICATHLLRSIAVRDVERAEQLGMLELDEEDLALCTYVCPCKNDYGTFLRETLNIIEKEG